MTAKRRHMMALSNVTTGRHRILCKSCTGVLTGIWTLSGGDTRPRLVFDELGRMGVLAKSSTETIRKTF